MKKSINLLLNILLIITIFSSCKKDNPDDQSDMRHVQINNIYETVSNDIFKTFLYGILAANDSLYRPNDSTNYRLNEPCISFNLSPFDTTTWPKTLLLSFPSGGCECTDGVIRAGDLSIEIQSPGLQSESKFLISLNNYSIESLPVSGYKKIYGTSGVGLSFLDTTSLQVTTPFPATQWSASHNIQFALGSSTHQEPGDDLFIYNGKATCLPITANDDLIYNATIIEAMQFINNCYWIGSGKIEIIPYNLSGRTVTYLDSCINQATITVNNENQIINF